MNWIDIVVIAIIVGLGVIGLKKGLVYSLFKFVSFFLSAFLAIKLYPLVAKVLAGTELYTSIKAAIFKRLMLQQQAAMPGLNESTQVTAKSVIEGLNLPGFVKDMVANSVVKSIPNISELVNVSGILDSVSDVLAHVIINIISLVVLFIVIKIGLFIVESMISGVTDLPVLKQADKFGGFALGALEGVLVVYAAFAIMMMFNTVPLFQGFFDAVENSALAGVFYQNNFILDWMFPKNVIV
ncbi:MAG TPA: CvpA family protein [Acetivibrio sp.]|nr:CvpA family protein [Acetivibrio sp.]